MTEIEMTLPDFFYTEPRCRTSSPDFGKLKRATEVTPDTPGARLWLALCYYRVEAYATKKDRDAACGPTAYEDVQYFPASGKNLSRGDITLDDIACGYSVDDPHFDTILTPIFDAAVKRLIRDVITAPKGHAGMIASATISIARVQYEILAEQSGDWIKFLVEGRAVFEEVDDDLMERTAAYLEKRLMLQMSPSLINAKCN